MNWGPERGDWPKVASSEGSKKGFSPGSGPFFLQAPSCMLYNQTDSRWTGGGYITATKLIKARKHNFVVREVGIILREEYWRNQSVFQFSSVQSCPTLCDPMNCSTPGLPVHHQLPQFTQTHVHRVSDAIPHLILCRPLLLLSPIPPSIRVFSMSQTFTWGGQSTGISAFFP